MNKTHQQAIVHIGNRLDKWNGKHDFEWSEVKALYEAAIAPVVATEPSAEEIAHQLWTMRDSDAASKEDFRQLLFRHFTAKAQASGLPKEISDNDFRKGDLVTVDMATFEGIGKVLDVNKVSVLVQWPDNRKRWFDKSFVYCPVVTDEVEEKARPSDKALRWIVETIVRRTAQAQCPVEQNVQTAMKEFDLELAKLETPPTPRAHPERGE